MHWSSRPHDFKLKQTMGPKIEEKMGSFGAGSFSPRPNMPNRLRLTPFQRTTQLVPADPAPRPVQVWNFTICGTKMSTERSWSLGIQLSSSTKVSDADKYLFSLPVLHVEEPCVFPTTSQLSCINACSSAESTDGGQSLSSSASPLVSPCQPTSLRARPLPPSFKPSTLLPLLV
jgi:hypothetical protein